MAAVLRRDLQSGMTDLETALRLLELEEKWVQPFVVQDPFGGFALEGFLSQRPDHRYGALAITRVDGKPAPQRVLATPKIHYPFDRGGKFRFPPVAGSAIFTRSSTARTSSLTATSTRMEGSTRPTS